MKKILLSAILILLIPVLSFAQVTKERDVIGSAGDYSTTPSIELAWTVGEVAVNYSENPNLIVSEGFEQGDEEGVGIEEEMFSGTFSVYPNPVNDELFYEISTDMELVLTGALFDESGRLVMEIPRFMVSESYTGQIPMTEFAAGKWVLKFYAPKDGFERTFNVIKVD